MIKNYFLCVKLTALFFLSAPTLAQPLTPISGNSWGGIFADQVTLYEINLSGERNSSTSISWKIISKGRTLSNGQQTIKFAKDESLTTILPLKTPPLKPGITLEAQLIVEEVNKSKRKGRILYQSKLVIYGPDILLTDRNLDQNLNIQLFDPIGKTSKILSGLKIPYKARTKSQLLNLKAKGLIILGAGIALDRQRGLVSALIELAEKGHRVLILQPVSGNIPFSPVTGSDIQPSRISFAGDSVVPSFAKGYTWITNDPEKNRGLALSSHRQSVSAKIAEYPQAHWDWLQLNYHQSGGQIIVCMLPFVEYIDDNPVPQIILSRLLTYANRHQK